MNSDFKKFIKGLITINALCLLIFGSAFFIIKNSRIALIVAVGILQFEALSSISTVLLWVPTLFFSGILLLKNRQVFKSLVVKWRQLRLQNPSRVYRLEDQELEKIETLGDSLREIKEARQSVPLMLKFFDQAESQIHSMQAKQEEFWDLIRDDRRCDGLWKTFSSDSQRMNRNLIVLLNIASRLGYKSNAAEQNEYYIKQRPTIEKALANNQLLLKEYDEFLETFIDSKNKKSFNDIASEIQFWTSHFKNAMNIYETEKNEINENEGEN